VGDPVEHVVPLELTSTIFVAELAITGKVDPLLAVQVVNPATVTAGIPA
jgi:hypothetical protein